ncbi:hypothetical protein OESDEN_18817, partial [Oesophagostomum dentatum]
LLSVRFSSKFRFWQSAKIPLSVIFAVEDRYKTSAKDGKEFLLASANDTLCDRPYTLRNQALLDVDSTLLQPYDEKLDTTTALPTTTPEAQSTTEEITTPFTL